MCNTLFPNGWDNMPNRLQNEEVSELFDKNRHEWLDKEHKPCCCYRCPFSVWYTDYKRCTVLKRQLHPYFRIDARLKDCPIQINGL